MRVLILDDNEFLLRGLRTSLERRCEVVTATSIDAALLLLDEIEFDAVITDFELGEERDGAWFLSQVAARLPDAKRIVLSGSNQANNPAVRSIAHHAVPKPATLSELLSALFG